MSIGSFFKSLCPFLSVAAETFGGPAGAIAASVLSKVAGADVKPSAIASTIQSLSMTEDGRLKLDAAEKEFQITMAKMGFDEREKFVEALVSDRASARDMQKATRSYLPSILAFAAVSTLLFCIYLVGFRTLPDTGHDALMILLGAVVALVKDVYGFIFGGSMGQEQATNLLSQAPAVKQ